ncbi:hypothetical protein GCM10007852_34280 [Agaribacter marinus]|uniref:Uncharacterized protein n=1 Tax=Agaribacter marinus TaxID=1431249 RepID=A0AA37T6Q6_9ALTE|nr:hypothetical protein GCM10007852_34280 [Agaribacter marinus]
MRYLEKMNYINLTGVSGYYLAYIATAVVMFTKKKASDNRLAFELSIALSKRKL